MKFSNRAGSSLLLAETYLPEFAISWKFSISQKHFTILLKQFIRQR